MSKIDLKFDKIKKKVVSNVKMCMKTSDIEPLGKFAKEMIQRRTRLGYGVSNNGNERERLKPLSLDYIQHRENTVNRVGKSGKQLKSRKIKGANQGFSNFLSSVNSDKLNTGLTTPRKSNLTMTGQMLDAIEYIIRPMKIILLIGNTKRNDSDLTNKEVAIYATKQGRPFFNFSKSEIRQMTREASKIIKAKLKSLTKF